MTNGNNDPKTEAEARAAIANAITAEVAAQKAEREEKEASSPQAQALREAERIKGLAQAGEGTQAARREEIASFIPDVSKVDRGKLEAGTQPLFGATLAQAALHEASRILVTQLRELRSHDDGGQERPPRILVTSDTSLVDSDAICIQVMNGLEWLNQSSETLLKELQPPPVSSGAPPALARAFLAAPALAALASAVPGVLSLFSAQRSITAATIDPGDLAAAAAVMGELRKQAPAWEVVHDDVRLLAEDGKISVELHSLNDHRQRLVTHVLAGKANPEQTAQIHAAIQSIDEFVKSITSVPTGESRSPLTIALRREALHEDDSIPKYVLVIKSQGASLQGVTDDKPLWFKDRFSTVAALNLTFFFLEAGRPGAVAAGTLAGRAVGTGTIGDDLKLKVTVTSQD
jgi:hypothetical protein